MQIYGECEIKMEGREEGLGRARERGVGAWNEEMINYERILHNHIEQMARIYFGLPSGGRGNGAKGFGVIPTGLATGKIRVREDFEIC